MINIPHPAIVEIFGAAGFDMLILDAEHGAVDRAALHDLMRAADAVHVPMLVRIPHRDAVDWIEAALDAGAAGIVVPRIETAEQVAAAARAAKYPPAGVRGSGPSRAARYGLDIQGQLRTANRETLVAIMLETAEAVKGIAQITAVPGLDMVLVGPNDLGISLQHSDIGEDVAGASAIVAGACVAAGVVCGSFLMRADELPGARSLGMRAFVTGSDLFGLIRSAREAIADAARRETP